MHKIKIRKRVFKREEGRNERALEYVGLEAGGRGNWKEEGDSEEGKGRQWGRETNQNRIE